MIRYIPTGCRKCDFGRREPYRSCKLGMCNTYEETYSKVDIDYEFGFATLEEFNEYYGTYWQE